MKESIAFITGGIKSHGYSVRCIRDWFISDNITCSMAPGSVSGLSSEKADSSFNRIAYVHFQTANQFTTNRKTI